MQFWIGNAEGVKDALFIEEVKGSVMMIFLLFMNSLDFDSFIICNI